MGGISRSSGSSDRRSTRWVVIHPSRSRWIRVDSRVRRGRVIGRHCLWREILQWLTRRSHTGKILFSGVLGWLGGEISSRMVRFAHVWGSASLRRWVRGYRIRDRRSVEPGCWTLSGMGVRWEREPRGVRHYPISSRRRRGIHLHDWASRGFTSEMNSSFPKKMLKIRQTYRWHQG